MFDFLEKRLQKTINNLNKKTILEENDINEITREIKLSLLEADVNLLVIKSFINNVKSKIIGSELIGKLNPGQQMVKIVHQELIDILGKETKEIKLQNNLLNKIVMVGLQGSGKTTSTAKLAAYFRKSKKASKILLIAADIYRPAAIDQLKTLGKQIDIDVYEEGINVKPQIIVENGLKKAYDEKYDLVIIDTAGRLSINEELMNELVDIKKIAKPNEIFFVLDAQAGQEIINVAKEFDKHLNLTGAIITKLDSNARGGAALSISYLLNKPINFIGTGEKINNLDVFHPKRMADRILGMGDVLSLVEKMEEVIDKDKAKKLGNRLFSGSFDLDDLLQSLYQIKKMGSLSKLIKLIPGVKGIDTSKIQGAEAKIKLFEILISSMTMQERKNPKLLKNASRKNRILKGSGRTAQEYNSLVNEFEQMSKKMKEMTKNMKMGNGFF